MKLTSTSKIVIFFSTVIVSISVYAGYSFYSQSQVSLIKEELSSQTIKLGRQQADILNIVARLKEDVKFLSSTPPIKGIVRTQMGLDPIDGSSNALWMKRLSIIFEQFLMAKTDYLKLRYIGVADDGRELVDVGVEAGVIKHYLREELQQQGSRPFFIDTLVLKENQVHLSSVNLCREHGGVNLPHMPVIHASTPVFDEQGTVFGVVIATFNAKVFLDVEMNSGMDGSSYYVTNEKGEFLLHPNREKSFGFEFGKEQTIMREFSELALLYKTKEILLLGENKPYKIVTEDRVLQFSRVVYDSQNTEKFIGLYINTPKNSYTLLAFAEEEQKIINLTILIAICSICVFFVAYFVYKRKSLARRIGLGYAVVATLLAASVATTIWQSTKLSAVSDRLREVSSPTVKSNLAMLNGINHSLAALRGWMILGETKFKTERSIAWDEIKAATAELNNLEKFWGDNDNDRKQFSDLKIRLVDFRKLQQKIEYIANTPENNPALKLFLTEILPLVERIELSVDNMIDLEKQMLSAGEVLPERFILFNDMREFRTSLQMEISSIEAYMLVGDEKFRQEFERNFGKNETFFHYIGAEKGLLTMSERREYETIKQLTIRLNILLKQVVDSKSGKQWNIANYLLEVEAAPMTVEIKDVLTRLLDRQQLMMSKDFMRAEQQSELLVLIQWILLVFGVMVSGILGYYITRSVIRPMGRALWVTNTVAKGDFDIDVNVTGSKEMEQFGRAMSKMIESLKDTAEVTRLVTSGDMDVRVNVKSDKDRLALSVNQMIETIKLTREQSKSQMQLLIQSQERSDSIVNLMVDGLITMNDKGIVRSFNPAAEKMFGYVAQEIIGNNIRLLMPEPYQGDHDVYLKNYKDTGRRKILGSGREVQGKRKSGDVFALDLAVSEVIIGEEVMYVGTLRDVTERNQSEQVLKKEKLKLVNQEWLQSSLVKLTEVISAERTLEKMANCLLSRLVPILEAQLGAFYIVDDLANHLNGVATKDLTISLLASYAFDERKDINYKYHLGERLIGQAALEKKAIFLANVPDNYLQIASALGSQNASEIAILPVLFEGQLMGVMEIAFMRHIGGLPKELMQQVVRTLGVYINSIAGRSRAEAMLEKLKTQAVDLESQAEKLKNREEALKKSNVELERNTKLAEQANKSKSEFLANMSHELRTPLNSLLILAEDLSLNENGHLDEEELESINIIKNSGKDLLILINDVLDLAKIESGKMEVNLEKVWVEKIATQLTQDFGHLAKRKNLVFSVDVDNTLPESISTDQMKLMQILRNFLSNAFKFTEQGSVTVKIYRPQQSENFQSGLESACAIAFSVIDTGIGIDTSNLDEIFESFQQADSSTSRMYGGTGLGLAISREFSLLLDGEIKLESQLGEGSTFTVYLPDFQSATDVPRIKSEVKKTKFQRKTEEVGRTEEIIDDRHNLSHSDNIILVIEGDASYSETLSRQIHKQGAKCIRANDGETGINLAMTYVPDAIILDAELPGAGGIDVFDQLKANPSLSHIPIYFVSVFDGITHLAERDVIGYLTKPVSREQLKAVLEKIGSSVFSKSRNILVIEDDISMRRIISAMLEGEGFNVLAFDNAEDGYVALQKEDIQMMILDLQLPGMSGLAFLDRISADKLLKQPPVMIYSGMDVSKEDAERLAVYTDVFLKKNGGTPDHILSAVFESAGLASYQNQNSVEDDFLVVDEKKRNDILENKSVLLVDDDTRNIFALSKVLKNQLNMKVYIAENGEKSLEILDEVESIDIVLMDIMMPGMDGYEAITEIRKKNKFDKLPILAVTAKAMKEDRDKCFDVGANDFVAKPIEATILFSVMAKWLGK